MKMKNSKILSLFAITAALATGCAVSYVPPTVSVSVPEPVVTVGAPVYAEPVVSVGVPEYYAWDGVEYVGMVGGRYMYLGAGGGWLVCDSVRLGRFNGWERGHPDWRRTAIHNAGANARGRRGPVRKEEKHEERR
jgi:hypothetical protein